MQGISTVSSEFNDDLSAFSEGLISREEFNLSMDIFEAAHMIFVQTAMMHEFSPCAIAYLKKIR